MINEEMLKILVCPKCKGELEYRPSEDGKGGDLACHQCGVSYLIEDDIPNLIIEDAVPLTKGDAQ